MTGTSPGSGRNGDLEQCSNPINLSILTHPCCRHWNFLPFFRRPAGALFRQALQLEDASERQAVHRFRDRFRRHLRGEIAETIASIEESAINRELEELSRALRGGG